MLLNVDWLRMFYVFMAIAGLFTIVLSCFILSARLQSDDNIFRPRDWWLVLLASVGLLFLVLGAVLFYSSR